MKMICMILPCDRKPKRLTIRFELMWLVFFTLFFVVGLFHRFFYGTRTNINEQTNLHNFITIFVLFSTLCRFGRRFVSHLHVSRTSPSSSLLPVMPFEMGNTFSGCTVTKFIEHGIFVTWWIWWMRRIRQVNEMNDCLGQAKNRRKKCERREWKLKWFGDAPKSFVCVCVRARDNRTLSRLDAVRSERQVSWRRMVAILRWRTSYLSVTGITHPNNLRRNAMNRTLSILRWLKSAHFMPNLSVANMM